MGSSRSGQWGGRLRCESVPSIDVRVWGRNNLLEAGAEAVRLSYPTTTGGSRTEQVNFDRTPCNYGGTRVWFCCLGCGRRVATLYFRQDLFRCRRCHGLRYRSQLTASSERPRIAAQRIRLRLGGSGNLTIPFPDKPEKMRWSAYYRMRAKGERYEARAMANLAFWLERLKAAPT